MAGGFFFYLWDSCSISQLHERVGVIFPSAPKVYLVVPGSFGVRGLVKPRPMTSVVFMMKRKAWGVYVLDEMAQLGDLRQIHDSENDFFVFSAEPALSVEEGSAVMNISQNGVRHFKRFVGNDESRFPLGEADDDTAGNGGVDVHGDEGADGRFQCKDPRAGHDDDEVQAKDDVADFQIVKFF